MLPFSLETLEPRDCPAAGTALRTVGYGAGYELQINSAGRVAVLQIDPTEYSQWREGDDTIADLKGMTRRILDHLPDAFDFLFLVDNELATPNSRTDTASEVAVQSSVMGVGTKPYDRTSEFGSAGRLQGIVRLPDLHGIRVGPSLHEIAHQWAAYLPTFSQGSPDPTHWGFSGVGGQLGGWEPGTLRPLGEGLYQAMSAIPGTIPFSTFSNGGNRIPYSPLELYLMGLIGPEDVAVTFEVARDPVWIDRNKGIFSASRIDQVTIRDVIAQVGPRVPSIANSPKSFRGLVAVITPTPG